MPMPNESESHPDPLRSTRQSAYYELQNPGCGTARANTSCSSTTQIYEGTNQIHRMVDREEAVQLTNLSPNRSWQTEDMVHRATQWLLHTGSLLKRAVHRATAPRSAPVAQSENDLRTAEADRLVRLLFPDGNGDALIHETLSAHDVTATTVRRALGQANQHSTPTPFSVRLSPSDVAYVSVGGIDVALDTADQSVSAHIIEAGEWEPRVVHVLRKYLTAGSVFVDIGANVGWHTVVGSSIVGSAGRVYAIEPNPDNARLIAHTVQRNNLTNVELLPFALSERTGFAAFRSAIGSNGGFAWGNDPSFIDPAVTIVPTVRFDDLDIAHVDVIKMDVEGAEPQVMRGAVEMIERDHPVIVFEFSCEMTQRVGGVAPREHLRFFEDHGYTLSIIDRADGSQIPVTDVDALLRDWGTPFRIEDFVAVHSSHGALASPS